MKLSDGMALGRMLIAPCRFPKNMKPGDSGSRKPAEEGKGCALDMAVVAVRGSGNWHDAPKIWPWLLTRIVGKCDGAGDYLFEIAYKFDFLVCDQGKMTLDQLIDYVASVEPAEAEPASQEEPCTSNRTQLSAPLVADIVTWGT